MMPDREKVIEGLRHCTAWAGLHECQPKFGPDCPYEDEADCKLALMRDALAMLKQKETKYPICEKCGKEIDHINTSVFNYDGSDSNYSIPITYSNENGCVSFSTSQKWTGYDLTDNEQKEGIRCPYCGKFPFDDSIKIEFYEPVEVMMWTSEGR